jgi:lipoate---protein ligase
MRGRVAYKVPGGKLLTVDVDHEGDVIKSVRFTGDFFAHPEDAVERLEKRLQGVGVNDVRGIVAAELKDVRLYGVDSKSLVKAVWEAFG